MNDTERVQMAKGYDPEAFEDHPAERRSHVAAIQWGARRHLAEVAADNLLGSDWLTQHDAEVRAGALEEAAKISAAASRSTTLVGATSRPPADTEPANAGEYAASWNSRRPADREKLLEAILTGSRASIACFMGNHTARLAELAAEVVQLRETANEWQGKVYQANNVALDLAAKLVAVQDWLDDRAFPGADDDVLQQIIDRNGTPEGFERRNQYRAIWEGGSTSMPLPSMIPLLEEAERRDVVLVSERRAFLAGPWKSTGNDPTNQDPADQEPTS